MDEELTNEDGTIVVHINISLGVYEMNCPKSAVEKEGKIMHERAMEWMEEYPKTQQALVVKDKDNKVGYD